MTTLTTCPSRAARLASGEHRRALHFARLCVRNGDVYGVITYDQNVDFALQAGYPHAGLVTGWRNAASVPCLQAISPGPRPALLRVTETMHQWLADHADCYPDVP